MDPTKVPAHVIKAKLKAELGGIDTKYGKDFYPDKPQGEPTPIRGSRNIRRQQAQTMSPMTSSRNMPGSAFQTPGKSPMGATSKRNAPLIMTTEREAKPEKPSAIFLSQPRKPLDEDQKRFRKEYSDPNYDIRYTQTKAK